MAIVAISNPTKNTTHQINTNKLVPIAISQKIKPINIPQPIPITENTISKAKKISQYVSG